MYILTLTNKQTNKVHTYDNVIDINAGEKLYYRFQIDTLGLVDGEYDLELTKDGILVGVNTLYVGDYETYSLQYKRGDNTFIDITLNAKLEDATAEINVEKFTILPSEGYDGFSKVEIDATPLYDVAFGDGYASGNTDGVSKGIEIQKDLLESIVINENGTYTREDGYNEIVVDVPDTNGSYDEGYQAGIDYASDNANEIAAANAIVLDVTENKTYYTKYVDIPAPEFITGEYPNGEKFYDYANLKDIVYDTGIQVTPDTRFELWWKQDNPDDNYSTIIGAQGRQIMKLAEYNGRYVAEYAGGNYYFDMPVGWNHIIFSKADGVVVNGVQVVEFSDATAKNYPDVIYINASYLTEKDYNANGSFGMIKINNTIIIPTPDGFLNTNTNEMLSVAYTAAGGGYVYKNQDIIPIDNLIKQVNVNIKIDVKDSGIKFAYSTFPKVPDFYDFSNVTDMSYMFNSCKFITTIPELDTSKVTNMKETFSNCSALQTIPQLDTSNVIDMEACFQLCNNLTTIPQLDTSNVTNMSQLFYNSTNIISIPPLNANKLSFNAYQGLFYFSTMNKLTDFGGLIGFKSNANNDYTFVRCPNLTYQSCINILNGLADVTELGGKTLKVHQNFINLVGDEISIGINKGWTITA